MTDQNPNSGAVVKDSLTTEASGADHTSKAQGVEVVGWKQGNELAPFHPQASHIPPDYRDGWNHCYAHHERELSAAIALAQSRLEQLQADRAQALVWRKDAERYRLQRDHAQAVSDNLAKLLGAIHMRIYPKLPTVEGKTYRFMPPDPHLYLQALADEIRAIPDELAALSAKGGAV